MRLRRLKRLRRRERIMPGTEAVVSCLVLTLRFLGRAYRRAVIGSDLVCGVVTGGAGDHVRIRIGTNHVRHVSQHDRGLTWAAGQREIDALTAQTMLLR